MAFSDPAEVGDRVVLTIGDKISNGFAAIYKLTLPPNVTVADLLGDTPPPFVFGYEKPQTLCDADGERSWQYEEYMLNLTDNEENQFVVKDHDGIVYYITVTEDGRFLPLADESQLCPPPSSTRAAHPRRPSAFPAYRIFKRR